MFGFDAAAVNAEFYTVFSLTLFARRNTRWKTVIIKVYNTDICVANTQCCRRRQHCRRSLGIREMFIN